MAGADGDMKDAIRDTFAGLGVTAIEWADDDGTVVHTLDIETGEETFPQE